MSMNFQGYGELPGIGATLNTVERAIMWGLRERQILVPGWIDGTTTDSGNSPTSVLRVGLLMGKVTSTNKLVAWNPVAADGSQFIYGVLLNDQMTLDNSVSKDRFVWVLWGGNVKNTGLLVPGNASYGIVGDATEYRVRNQMAQNGRFHFDDLTTNPMGGWSDLKDLKLHSSYNGTPTPATVTLTAADNNQLFCMTTANKAINVTLPVMLQNYHFGFYVDADQSLTLTANPADTMVVFNDIAADSVALSTSSKKVGGFFEVFGLANGTALVIPHTWTDGTNTQTITIAT